MQADKMADIPYNYTYSTHKINILEPGALIKGFVSRWNSPF